jgi:hypothetical protein
MSTHPPAIPDTFKLLPIGAGPAGLLEQVIGYEGQARFWATWWGSGDEAYYGDDSVEATGDWQGYQMFVDHPAVAAVLAQVHADLGSSETQPRHLLMVDRETRQVYLARFNEGQRFLHTQRGPLPTMTTEELWAHVRRIQAEWQAKMEEWDRQPAEERHREVRQRIQAQQEARTRLQTWLTQQQTHQYN